MQVGRVQGIYSALNLFNNQTNLGVQNVNIRQTTNPFLNYSKPVYFGMAQAIAKPLKILKPDSELCVSIKNLQIRLFKEIKTTVDQREVIQELKKMPNNKTKLSHLFDWTLDSNVHKEVEEPKEEAMAIEILDFIGKLSKKDRRDFLMRYTDIKRTPLMQALWSEQHMVANRVLDMVEKLSKKDQKELLKMQDEDGKTCLIFALYNKKHPEIIERILDVIEKLGKNDSGFIKYVLKAQDKNGWSALMDAIWKKQSDAANRMLDIAEGLGKNFLRNFHVIRVSNPNMILKNGTHYDCAVKSNLPEIAERIKCQANPVAA